MSINLVWHSDGSKYISKRSNTSWFNVKPLGYICKFTGLAKFREIKKPQNSSVLEYFKGENILFQISWRHINF